MRKIAVEQSSLLLEKVRFSIAMMEGAKNLSELESAWSDFLIASQRIHSKLEQGAKGNKKSYAWWGLKLHQRRTDPILRYTHHARNVDEHGLAQITERTPPTVAIGVGPGTWRLDGVIGGPLKVTALGGQVPEISKFVEFGPAKVNLVRVVDKGDPYDPPLDEHSNPLSPIEVAKIVFKHLLTIIEQASQLPE